MDSFEFIEKALELRTDWNIEDYQGNSNDGNFASNRDSNITPEAISTKNCGNEDKKNYFIFWLLWAF